MRLLRAPQLLGGPVVEILSASTVGEKCQETYTQYSVQVLMFANKSIHENTLTPCPELQRRDFLCYGGLGLVKQIIHAR